MFSSIATSSLFLSSRSHYILIKFPMGSQLVLQVPNGFFTSSPSSQCVPPHLLNSTSLCHGEINFWCMSGWQRVSKISSEVSKTDCQFSTLAYKKKPWKSGGQIFYSWLKQENHPPSRNGRSNPVLSTSPISGFR